MLGCCSADGARRSRHNASWWHYWVCCLLVEEVPEKGEETTEVQFWKQNNGQRWIKTTMLELWSPPERILGSHLKRRITSFTPCRQFWSLLPRNDITYHSFTILEVADELESEFAIVCEKKDDQLEIMLGEGPAARDFMRNFRAIGRPRLVQRCEVGTPQPVKSGITVGTLLEWIDGPLARRWEPYSLLEANCQHFTADLLHFLADPGGAEWEVATPRERALALAAVKGEAEAMLHVHDALRRDRRFVLEAVEQNPGALGYAPEDFHRDWRVVLNAVARDGTTLRHAGHELRADRELVLTAVAQNGLALQHAPLELRGDREVAVAAVKQNAKALQFVAEHVRKDPQVTGSAGWADLALLSYTCSRTSSRPQRAAAFDF